MITVKKKEVGGRAQFNHISRERESDTLCCSLKVVTSDAVSSLVFCFVFSTENVICSIRRLHPHCNLLLTYYADINDVFKL